ncbi:hypothetical protein [Kitasatospora humi]|nr:hypothetical protein [Kitasatospora humi]
MSGRDTSWVRLCDARAEHGTEHDEEQVRGRQALAERGEVDA